MELYQIVLLVCAAIIAVLYIVNRIWHVNLLQKIVLAKPVIGAVASAVEAVANVSGNQTLKLVYMAMKAGAESAQFAEQAWLMGELDKEHRNDYAKGLANAILVKAGIEVTPQVEMIISGIIEAVCFLLPHGVEPKVGD